MILILGSEKMGLFGRILKGSSGKEGVVEKEPKNNPTSSVGTFRVVDVFNIAGIGVIPVGEVMSGQLSRGMKANLNGKIVEIKSMEMNHQQLSVANTGDKVGMSLKGAKKEDVQKGQIIEFSRNPKSASAGETLSAMFG